MLAISIVYRMHKLILVMITHMCAQAKINFFRYMHLNKINFLRHTLNVLFGK